MASHKFRPQQPSSAIFHLKKAPTETHENVHLYDPKFHLGPPKGALRRCSTSKRLLDTGGATYGYRQIINLYLPPSVSMIHTFPARGSSNFKAHVADQRCHLQPFNWKSPVSLDYFGPPGCLQKYPPGGVTSKGHL